MAPTKYKNALYHKTHFLPMENLKRTFQGPRIYFVRVRGYYTSIPPQGGGGKWHILIDKYIVGVGRVIEGGGEAQGYTPIKLSM